MSFGLDRVHVKVWPHIWVQASVEMHVHVNFMSSSGLSQCKVRAEA